MSSFLQKRPNRRGRQVRLFVTILLTIAASSLPADRVYLRNGRQLDGIVVRQTRNDITFRLGNGQTQSIQKSDILRMVYGNAARGEQLDEEKRKQDEATKTEPAGKDSSTSVDPTSDLARPGTFGAAWRSALVPGWGQYTSGDRRSAIEVGILFLGAGAYAAQRNAVQRSDHRAYNRTSLQGFLAYGQQGLSQTAIQMELVRREKGQYHSSLRSYEQAISILVFFYVAQIAQALWIGRSSGSPAAFFEHDRAPTLSIEFVSQQPDSFREHVIQSQSVLLTFTGRF